MDSRRSLPSKVLIGGGNDTDAKVGGTGRMSFMNFSTGRGYSFGGEYLELMVTAV